MDECPSVGILRFKHLRLRADGIRCQKNNTKYVLDGSRILKEYDGTKTILYYYGANGVIGFRYNGVDYYYRKNLFGDVLAIYDSNGTVVAEYLYDAWGRVLAAIDKTDLVIANINPFRYRSYYYDTETGLYYLESRYYDPQTGRFINTDSLEYLGDGEDLKNYNLFAYCENNPVMRIDTQGTKSGWALAGFLVGSVLCFAALTVMTGGVGTVIAGTLAGAVTYGAAQGILAGAAIGIVGGGIVGGILSDWSLEGIFTGAGIGFGAGAIIGGAIGCMIGAKSYSLNSTYLEQCGANVKEVLSAFKGNPRLKTLKADTVVYRSWGGASGKFSHWVSPIDYGPNVRSALALPDCNTAENFSTFVLKQGTKALQGRVAPNFGQYGGGAQWWVKFC